MFAKKKNKCFIHNEIIKSGNKSIRNSRYVVMLNVIICIIAIIGWWNSKEDSRLNKRIDTITRAYKYNKLTEIYNAERFDVYRFKNQIAVFKEPPIIIDTIRANNLKDTLNKRLVKTTKPKIDFDSVFIYTLEAENIIDKGEFKKYFNAVKYCRKGNIPLNKTEIVLENFLRIKLENVLIIRIPFFGISIDVNDLSLAIGLGFIVMFIVLIYTLIREFLNIEILFNSVRSLRNKNKIDNETYIRIYQYVSMNNVMTVEPQLKYPDTSKGNLQSKRKTIILGVLRLLSKLILVIPLIFYLITYVHDRNTEYISTYLNDSKMSSILILNLALLIVLFVLGFIVIFCSLRIDKIWKKEANSLRKIIYSNCDGY